MSRDQDATRPLRVGPAFLFSVPRKELSDSGGSHTIYRVSDTCYYAYGRGHLTESMMHKVFGVIEDFRLHEPYAGIVDWFDLTSYDTGARTYGQQWAAEHHNDLACVYLGTSSKIVWMAAQVVNVALKSRLQPFQTRKELDAATTLLTAPYTR